jgi:hypothetical protein
MRVQIDEYNGLDLRSEGEVCQNTSAAEEYWIVFTKISADFTIPYREKTGELTKQEDHHSRQSFGELVWLTHGIGDRDDLIHLVGVRRRG